MMFPGPVNTFVLRIDYCDERLVYSNDDISVTKGGTYINNTPIKRPDFSLFNDMT